MIKYENVAFIPVRGGSKSIPLKNIKHINGRPLVYWVLDAVNECDYIDRVFVSTDSDEIKYIVERYNSDKLIVIERSYETATDIASTESAMLEFANNYYFNNIVLIQATSPLLESKYLCEGFDKIKQKEIDSVLSVVNQKRFIWNKNSDKFIPYNYNPQSRPRRQDFNGYFVENGAFYITTRDNLLNSKCRISGNIDCVIMDEESYFEIDEVSDWIIVEQLLKRKHRFKFDFNKIKIVLTDNDGVLTDGGMYYTENNDEIKKFNTKDGMAFELLRNKGIKTGIITGEDRELVKRRCKKLLVDEIHLGIKDKLSVINMICDKYNIGYENVVYVGDDINDIEAIKKVGFGCSVSDAMECVREVSDYVTQAKGGEGALREIADLIIKNIE